MLSKEHAIAEGISDHKFLESPGLRFQGRTDCISRQILLIQGLTVGDANPTDRATARWRIWEVIQVQRYPVPFEDSEMLVVICGLKAQLPIEDQGLLQILDDKSRSHTQKGWLALKLR